MQNLNIENKYLLIENKKQIKNLWCDIFFEDDENTVDKFLRLVFKNKKGVGAFSGNKLIAMILFLDAKIAFENNEKKAVYLYAVCTHKEYRNLGIMKSLISYAKKKLKEQGYEICFLVPENEGLFNMYENLSFFRNMACDEILFFREHFDIKNILEEATDFCYKDYSQLRKENTHLSPMVILSEDEFNFIFDKLREDVSFVFLDSGYAVYEKNENNISISEICGDDKKIVSAIFKKHPECISVKVMVPSINSENFYGMTCSLEKTQEAVPNIYFGMPYR